MDFCRGKDTPPLNASLASPFGRGGGEADGEGESVTRPSQSPAVTALPEGEPRLQLFYGHPRDSGGNGGWQPPQTPAPRRRGAMSLGCNQALKSAGGVAPLARGPLAPLKSRFKGIGFSGKGGNRNPPFPERVFGYFLHGQKVTRAWGWNPHKLGDEQFFVPTHPARGKSALRGRGGLERPRVRGWNPRGIPLTVHPANTSQTPRPGPRGPRRR